MTKWTMWDGSAHSPITPMGGLTCTMKLKNGKVVTVTDPHLRDWSEVLSYSYSTPTQEDFNRLTARIKRLEEALADAIRRPMGVIPASAEGLVTQEALHAAEARRARAAYKDEPDAN